MQDSAAVASLRRNRASSCSLFGYIGSVLLCGVRRLAGGVLGLRTTPFGSLCLNAVCVNSSNLPAFIQTLR